MSLSVFHKSHKTITPKYGGLDDISQDKALDVLKIDSSICVIPGSSLCSTGNTKEAIVDFVNSKNEDSADIMDILDIAKQLTKCNDDTCVINHV